MMSPLDLFSAHCSAISSTVSLNITALYYKCCVSFLNNTYIRFNVWFNHEEAVNVVRLPRTEASFECDSLGFNGRFHTFWSFLGLFLASPGISIMQGQLLPVLRNFIRYLTRRGLNGLSSGQLSASLACRGRDRHWWNLWGQFRRLFNHYISSEIHLSCFILFQLP